jgi:hypothetical protein
MKMERECGWSEAHDMLILCSSVPGEGIIRWFSDGIEFDKS